jgi:hypothetical protein
MARSKAETWRQRLTDPSAESCHARLPPEDLREPLSVEPDVGRHDHADHDRSSTASGEGVTPAAAIEGERSGHVPPGADTPTRIRCIRIKRTAAPMSTPKSLAVGRADSPTVGVTPNTSSGRSSPPGGRQPNSSPKSAGSCLAHLVGTTNSIAHRSLRFKQRSGIGASAVAKPLG